MFGDLRASEIFKIIDETLSQPDNKLSLKKLCEIAGVSYSGYYNWINNSDKRKAKDKEDDANFSLILEAYKADNCKKGIEQIHNYFLHRTPQIIMNKKKIQRLVTKYRLKCNVRKPNYVTMQLKEISANLTYPYLVEREFKDRGPRAVLLTDITYIIIDGVHYYLSVIKDSYTNEILSHVVSESFGVEFVIETLKILKEKHYSELSNNTVINSDRGSHYKSYRYQDSVEELGIKISMSHKATCWDNAPIESFFGHMKDEIDLTRVKTFVELKEVIDHYIDYYNNRRYQTILCRLSPNQFYQFIVNDYYPSYLENIYPEKNLKLPSWIYKYKHKYKTNKM